MAYFAVFEGGAHRGRLLDLGTGSGIIPLVLVKRLGRKDITALELQPRLYSLAERSVYLNRCEEQVTLVQGDLRQVEQLAGVLREHQLEPKTARMVHPRADRPAKRVLLYAVKGGGADLTVLPPLVLHPEDEHAFTGEVSAMVE